MPFSTPFAPTSQELGSCVECGLCLPACPTFRMTGLETASPRGRLTAMSAVLAGRPIDAAFEEMMNGCLQCKACETVCPAFVPFGRVMEGAKAEIAVARNSLPSRLRRLILGKGLASRSVVKLATAAAAVLQKTGTAFLIPKGLRPGFRGLRPLSIWSSSRVGQSSPPLGEDEASGRGTVGLLVGCVTDPWFGSVNEAATRLLNKAGYVVITPADQSCCGALAAHDGAAKDASRLAAQNAGAFEAMDTLVVTSAGCSAHMKQYGHWTEGGEYIAKKVHDITELVADAIGKGWLPTMAETLEPVAIQDPCHLRHAQRIVDEPRRVVQAAGFKPIEIDPVGTCCGAAGVYSVLQPESSNRLGVQKADQVRAAGPTTVASANPGCEMQLRQHLGEDYRIVHPIELYAEAIGILGRADQ